MNKIIYEFRLLICTYLLDLIITIAPNCKEGTKLQKLIFNYCKENTFEIKSKLKEE